MIRLPLQITVGSLVQYTDETTYLYLLWTITHCSQAAALMNSQLQLISNFISDCRIMLNFSKSNVMWFHGNYRLSQIVVNDVILKVVDKQKYLGMTSDPKLSWTGQVPMFARRWHIILR